MLILVALAALQETYTFEARLDDEFHAVEGVKLETASGMARLLKTGVHSVSILLARTDDRWVVADGDHTLWVNQSRGGPFVDVTGDIEETPTHLKGTLEGRLVEAKGASDVRVVFALPRAAATQAPPPEKQTPFALLFAFLLVTAGLAGLIVRLVFFSEGNEGRWGWIVLITLLAAMATLLGWNIFG